MNGFKKNIFERCLPHIHRRSGNNGRDYDARAEENRHRNQTAGWQNPYEDAADSAGKQVASLVYGTKVLMYSAEILEKYYPEDYQKDKFDIWVEEHLGKEKAWNFLMVLSVILALIMSIGIFMLLPTAVVGWCAALTDNILILNLIEGVVRILIFVLYILLISRMKDIKTVVQYHGAEHKTIHCFENGLELTPENAQTFYTLHPRCGTSFLMFVMVVAILVHVFMGWPNVWLRMLTRILEMGGKKQ